MKTQIAVLMLALAVPSGSRAEGPASIQSLSWLAGCWERSRGERHFDEQWMSPRGGAMLGMGRTLAGDKMTEFEHMQIREEDGHLVFTAKPSGQEEASFRSIEVTASRVVFENASHDFPQRILYQREPDGSLLARIEGQQKGTAHAIDFPMRRISCGGDAVKRSKP